jgi:hypothetical protein
MFVGPLQLASNLKEWNMTNPMKIPGWPEAFSPQMPGFGAAGDGSGGLAGGLDFLKNLWGNSTGPVPGMVLPTLDVDELDQRIKDLKAVLRNSTPACSMPPFRVWKCSAIPLRRSLP